ncbi:hypothetical protein F4859DRAFT_192432 [Xylaria cf. heliscus]|nr:hypothetical protein F4859DRAFT_192432 [Xylaria cf. heliscus]
MSSVNSGNRRSIYGAMAAAKQLPVIIDLTQDDSEDDMDIQEAPVEQYCTIPNGRAEGQDLASDNQPVASGKSHHGRVGSPSRATQYEPVSPLPQQSASGASWSSFAPVTYKHRQAPKYRIKHYKPPVMPWSCLMPLPFQAPHAPAQNQRESPTLEESHLVALENSPKQATQEFRVAGEDGLPAESNDMLKSTTATDASGENLESAKSSFIGQSVALSQNRQENLDNGSDIPWEVFHRFMTIQRADFDSGKDFLRACEKLRKQVLITWNLKFTKKFTHTFFINAMRSHDPLLANVLRHAERVGELEFHDLKRIIRKAEMTDDTIIGHQTWGEWKAQLLSTSGTAKGEDSDI